MYFLKSPLKNWLIASLFIAILVSCEMDDQFSAIPDIVEQDFISEDESIEDPATSERFRIGTSNLIYEETFEGSNPLSTAMNMQSSTKYGFAVAKDPAFEGSQSGRLELRYNDPIAHGGTRAEIFVIDRITYKERWYSFAAYFPASGYAYDSSNEILSQWHQGGSPALSLRTQKDRFYIRTIATNKAKNWENIDLGEITKDTWHEFVIRVIHSGKSDGLIEVWRNGVKVASRKGPNRYDDKPAPYWKLGPYKAIWNSNKATGSKKRVVYLDNIRVGNSNASFEEMTSGSSSVQTDRQEETASKGDNTSSSTSFTLIDAHVEKAIKTLTSGETISFQSVGTHKLNFEANVNSGVRSVKFELKGASSHTYLDKGFPFCLFGDDGRGNYYFGNRILPTGNYTLTATSYSDVNGRTPIGQSQSIRFAISK